MPLSVLDLRYDRAWDNDAQMWRAFVLASFVPSGSSLLAFVSGGGNDLILIPLLGLGLVPAYLYWVRQASVWQQPRLVAALLIGALLVASLALNGVHWLTVPLQPRGSNVYALPPHSLWAWAALAASMAALILLVAATRRKKSPA